MDSVDTDKTVQQRSLAPQTRSHSLNVTEYDVCVYILGPVVQSIVSLTTSLMTKSLTGVAKVFSNTLIFLLQKM